MSHDKARPGSAPRTLRPQMYSSLCANDLDLKAGFWDGDEQHPVLFRPIVGWVVVMNADEIRVVPFQPVVLNDFGAPVFAARLPGHIGVFGKAMTAEEARQKYALWQPKTPDAEPAGSQSGILN
jgi:hypothetical protein